MIKKSIYIIVFIVFCCQIVFAREHEVDWYEGYHHTSLTIGELVEKSNSGNPWELIADEMDINDWFMGGENWDYQYIPEETEELVDKANAREKDIEITISNELSSNNEQYLSRVHKEDEKIEFELYFEKYKKTLNIIIALIIGAVVLMVILRKWYIVLFVLPVIIALSLTFVPNIIQKNSRQSDLFNYLLNKSTNNISEKTILDYDLNSIDKYNMNHNVSKIINDYLIKTYICVKNKSNEIDLNSYEWYAHSDDQIFRSNIGNTMTNGNLIYNRFDYSLFNYTDGEAMSKEDMGRIYESITEEDIEDFNNGVFLNKFINRINESIKILDWENFNDMKFKDYLSETVLSVYFESPGTLDRNILYVLRYWYIDGKNSRDIELPYGIVLHYDKSSYIKKDIKEFDYSNAYFLNENIRNQENNVIYKSIRTYPFVESVDYNNKQDLFIYYYDSNSKRHGLCTDIEFVDEGIFKKNQMYFHPLDILYDVKPATVSMEYVRK